MRESKEDNCWMLTAAVAEGQTALTPESKWIQLKTSVASTQVGLECPGEDYS